MSDCFIIRKTFSFESNVDKFAKIILNNFSAHFYNVHTKN